MLHVQYCFYFFYYLYVLGYEIILTNPTVLSYLHFIITESNDAQSFSHHLPVIAVINGAHFWTVTL